MSGYFDYIQNSFDGLITELQNLTEANYTEATIYEFERALEMAKELHILIDRIDYLVSGEETEESFHQGLIEDLEEIDEFNEFNELQF